MWSAVTALLRLNDFGVSRPAGADILPYRDSSSQTTEFAPRFRSAQATSTRLKYSIARFFLRTAFASINAVDAVHKS